MDKTQEQIKYEVLAHVRMMVHYWDEQEGRSVKEKLEGLAFSILVMIDGESALPAFILAPDPHPDDKQFHIDEEEDYYPENYEVEVKGNISGSLHDEFYIKE